MKKAKLTYFLTFLLTFSISSAFCQVKFRYIEDPSRVLEGFVWESKIPEDCPFKQSELFNRIYFTGKFSDYICGDTFYPTWAENGNLYSPWTDGSTDGMVAASYSGGGKTATTGHAVMIGDDPESLIIENTSAPKVASALPYQGRYPGGSLIHNGVWYYATYCLTSDDKKTFANPTHNGFKFNWPVLGPVPGFQISYDYGKTWVDSPLTADNPLFPEPKIKNGAVKIGAPHFVDFGKNMEHSPDGKAYLVAMGALDDDPMPRPCIVPVKGGKGYEISDSCPDKHFKHANLSWVTADQIYLTRVTPTPDNINNEDAYEYFAGHDNNGKAIWSNEFEQIKPLIEWNNNMGCVTATYVPQLKKYIMCITDGWPTVAKMDSYFLEADELTGPWSIITYLEDFGEQSYFLNFPSKFISESGKDMWLCHSANFAPNWNGTGGLKINPVGGRYGLSLHEMTFLSKDDKIPAAREITDKDIFKGNIAPKAKVTASSEYPNFPATSVIDGIVASSNEWASAPTSSGKPIGKTNYVDEWIKLEWEQKEKINKIILFDRIYRLEQNCEGMLVFSDGSFITVDKELPPSAFKGLEITFDEKEVEWVLYVIKKHGWNTKNPGLSEFAVFPAN